MSFSFFSKSPGGRRQVDELALVMGIESGLVRGSLVLFPASLAPGASSQTFVTPRVLYTVSSEIVSREGNKGKGSGSVKLLSAMLDAVSRVAGDIAQTGLKISAANSVTIPISKIHVIFSSPWIISKTKTVKISYEKETEITKAAVDAIVDGERRDLEQRFLAEHDKTLEFDLAFVEQKIFEVKLNGYPTLHFEGKKARELETSFAISISSKSILSHIEKAVEKSVRTAKHGVECHSSLLLQYSALRDIVTGGQDYIAIHIHNEISDIIAVKRGVCAGMASFPQGTGVLSRASGIGLGQLKEVAHSSLNLQSKNAFHQAENRRVAGVADSSVQKWALQFMETLASLGQPDHMPRRVYLLANAHYSHYERALKGIKVPSFEVMPIEKTVLDSAIAHEKKEREDPLMSLYVFALR